MNKRKIIVTIMSISMIALMLRLGFWQIERLEWKENLLNKIKTQMSAKSSVSLPNEIPIEDEEEWDYKKVNVTGKYLNDKQFLLLHRVFNKKDGFHVITPFETENNKIILVNRGWVNKENLNNLKKYNKIINLSGVLKIPTKNNYFTPANSADSKFWIDIDEIKKQNNFDEVFNLLLYVDKQDNNDYPIGGQVKIDIPNDHFQYMIFWFFMAFVQLVFFTIFIRQNGNKNESI